MEGVKWRNNNISGNQYHIICLINIKNFLSLEKKSDSKFGFVREVSGKIIFQYAIILHLKGAYNIAKHFRTNRKRNLS